MSELLIPNVGAIGQLRESEPGAPDRKGPDAAAFERALRGQLRQKDPAAAQGAGAGAGALKFSSHALHRLKDRSISIGQELMGKLEKAVSTAAEKGSRESLILADNAAFIVSVKNKTVITVVDRNQMSGNVFTNIDSTVVI